METEQVFTRGVFAFANTVGTEAQVIARSQDDVLQVVSARRAAKHTLFVGVVQIHIVGVVNILGSKGLVAAVGAPGDVHFTHVVGHEHVEDAISLFQQGIGHCPQHLEAVARVVRRELAELDIIAQSLGDGWRVAFVLSGFLLRDDGVKAIHVGEVVGAVGVVNTAPNGEVQLGSRSADFLDHDGLHHRHRNLRLRQRFVEQGTVDVFRVELNEEF